MSRKTILVLVLVIAGLGYALWRELRDEAAEKRSEDVALLEGVDRSRVKRLLVENLRRGKSYAFDRLEDGRWRMTEPLAMPAEAGRVQRILDLLLDHRGSPLPAEHATAAELELEPPRALVEIEEEVGGARKRSRIDFGALDLDGLHVVVRTGGRILRTWRDVDAAVDAGLDELIDHAVVERPPRDVVEIHRKGTIAGRGSGAGRSSGAPTDLALDALADAGTWRATSPFSARLDPQGAVLLVQGCLGLRGITFPDVGRRLLSDFGLDPPEATIALGTATGQTLTIRIGRPKRAVDDAWHCVLEGQPIVWTIDGRSVEFLTAPADSFVDGKLVRIPSAEVDGVSLSLGGRELRLWRTRVTGLAEGRWLAAERPGPESAFSASLPADLRRVEALIGRIADLEVANFLPGEQLAEGEVRGAIVVQARDEQQGGSIGAAVGDVEHGRGVRFQRRGETIAGLVDPVLADLATTPLSDVLSLLVVDVVEIDLVGLSIAGAGAHRTFVRSSKGLWTPPDVSVEARELRPVLDGITILRAARYLGDGAEPPLQEPIEIELTDSTGAKTKFAVGLAPEGTAEGERIRVERDGRRAVAKDQGLHARLLAVLRGG